VFWRLERNNGKGVLGGESLLTPGKGWLGKKKKNLSSPIRKKGGNRRKKRGAGLRRGGKKKICATDGLEAT